MNGSELSERKKRILMAIVESHIENGEPVGSKSLLQSSGIACSSATVRNEMAELEELGYLEQPHTSAGRVPSQLGYRFYVDALIEHYAETKSQVEQIEQILHTKTRELDQILIAASRLASSMTHYTGLAAKPAGSATVIERFETAYIDPYNFVLVMVIAQSGAVTTRHIKTDMPLDRAIVEHLSSELNTTLSGLTSDKINLPVIVRLESAMEPYSAIVNPIIKAIYDTMSKYDDGSLELSGINHLLEYDYSDVTELRELLGTLEQKDEILKLVSDTNSTGDDMTVFIGSESPVHVMNNSTLIFKPVKQGGRTLGVIGVIGPLRMDYAKVLETIDKLSNSISALLDGENKKLIGSGGEDNND